MPMINCLNCGQPFSAERASARFHNDTCRKEYNRKKKKGVVQTPVGLTDTTSGEILDGAPFDLAEKFEKESGVIPMTLTEIEGMRLTPMKNPVIRKPRQKNTADKAIDPGEEKARLVKMMNDRLSAKGLPLLQEKPEPVQFVKTGIEGIDWIAEEFDEAGEGGLPRKHITEIFGPSGSGKTSLMNMIAKNTTNLKVLYIDAEGGLTRPPKHIVVSYVTNLETVEDIVIEALKTKSFDLIIIDSVAILTSEKEVEGDKESMGGKAKAMAKFGRRVNAAVKPLGPDGYPDPEAKTAVVFVNQLRDTMNAFGKKEFTPGGRTIEYVSSLRLELRSNSSDKIVRQGKMVGQKIRATVKKSRFGNVGETVAIKLIYADLA